MTSDPRNDPEERDKVLARVAAEQLRPNASSGGGSDAAFSAGADACPDAEVLAAYADRSLDPEQAARWESHFADCARCRKILAAVLVSADEPLLQDEVQKLGQSAGPVAVQATAPRTAGPPKPPVVLHRRSSARWVVPALAAAAAIILWFALRPATPPPTQFIAQNAPAADSVSPDVPAPEPSAPGAPLPGSALPDSSFANSKIAQSPIPPLPPSTFAPPGAGAAGQNLPGQNLAADSASALEKAKQEQPAAAVPAAPQVALDSARAAEPAFSRAAPEAGLQAAPSGNALTAGKTTPAGGATPNPAPAGLLGGARLAETQTLRTSGPLAPAPEKKVASTFTFASPGGAQWRGGTVGLIEHSTDQGRTWQAQASGVTLDLAAGSAPSDQVAWIVGHAGVILRTTDGGTWQRVTSPNATITDWTGVEASDAQHATITAKDQHRFITTDGGQSWASQP